MESMICVQFEVPYKRLKNWTKPNFGSPIHTGIFSDTDSGIIPKCNHAAGLHDMVPDERDIIEG
jgi:hypothetical protein